MSKIALVVTVKVKPEYTEKLKPAMLENAKQSAQEETCYQFDVIVSQDDENMFMFYEVYKDEQALADHRQTPHFLNYDIDERRFLKKTHCVDNLKHLILQQKFLA